MQALSLVNGVIHKHLRAQRSSKPPGVKPRVGEQIMLRKWDNGSSRQESSKVSPPDTEQWEGQEGHTWERHFEQLVNEAG